MNKQQAQAEAERRWGRLALAWIIGGVRCVTDDPTPVAQGLSSKWRRFKGQGKTWQEAFASADKKDKASPELLWILQRLTDKIERANAVQHSGEEICADDWSTLYRLTEESKTLLEKVGRL